LSVRALQASFAVSVVVTSLVTFVVRANERPSAEYRRAMIDVEATSQLMRHHARMVEPGGDFGYAWIESDATKLKAAFEVTRAYWAARKRPQALTYAQNAVSDAEILERAAKSRHFDGVVAGVAGVLADCEPCHVAFREELPDGTFEIR
jgi:cytochrome c556